MDFLIGKQKGLYIAVLYLHMYKYVIESVENAATGYHRETLYIYITNYIYIYHIYIYTYNIVYIYIYNIFF